jgi:hypothetical protein
VIPSARASSCELIPFFEFATSQIAGSHFVSGSGESSKIGHGAGARKQV